MFKYFSNKEERYKKIIEILCEYRGVKKEELCEILKDKECKYLFYLLIRKYSCDDVEMLCKDFPKVNKKNINNNYKKAQEKLLLDRKIRGMYFEAEDIIKKVE